MIQHTVYKHFHLEKKPLNKITITISRRQLWYNFMECFTDMLWDGGGVDMFNEYADPVWSVLCDPFMLDRQSNTEKLKQLFRDGYTVNLLNGIKEVEMITVNDVLEIIVTDTKGPSIVIGYLDIVF